MTGMLSLPDMNLIRTSKYLKELVRAVAKLELLESELEVAKAELTTSHRLQIRDRATHAEEVARAKVENQLMEKEPMLSQEHLQAERDKYTRN